MTDIIELAGFVKGETDDTVVVYAYKNSELKERLTKFAQLLQQGEAVAWVPLSDVQWMNIVNHEHVWQNYNKDEAVHEAVKMTEAKCKENNTTHHQ